MTERTGHWRKRVLVCGGRYFDNLLAMRLALSFLDGEQAIALVINGGASGADTLARQWAGERGIPCETYPASWTVDGRSAGPKRNQRMLDQGRPDAVVAFPGGSGTADMVRRARKAGVPVYEPLKGPGEWDGEPT